MDCTPLPDGIFPMTGEALALIVLLVAGYAVYLALAIQNYRSSRVWLEAPPRPATPLSTMLAWGTEIGKEAWHEDMLPMPDVHTTQNDVMVAELEDDMRAEGYRPPAGGSRADRPMLEDR